MYGSQIDAKILADTISTNGARITTFEVLCPLHAHVHMLTHRAFSRNAQSNRAIPSKIVIKDRAVYVPSFWGKNKKGMSPKGEEITGLKKVLAIIIWNSTSMVCKLSVRLLSALGLHKETANRLISPFLMVNSIITATDFDNFFNLRISEHAQHDISILATKMKKLLDESAPVISNVHAPLVHDREKEELYEYAKSIYSTYDISGGRMKLYAIANRIFNNIIVQAVVGRCARVSYSTHNGFIDINKDINLHDLLLKDRHMSPFEHVAVASGCDDRHANLKGWYSYRSNIERLSSQKHQNEEA